MLSARTDSHSTSQVNGAIAFTTLTLFNTLRLPLVKLPKS
jgi:hypothetical protein